MPLYHLWPIVFQIFHIFHLTCSKTYRSQNKEFQIQRHSQLSLDLARVLSVCTMSFGDYIQISKVRHNNKLRAMLHLHQTIWRYSYTTEYICHAYIYICIFFLICSYFRMTFENNRIFLSLIYSITSGIQVSLLIFQKEEGLKPSQIINFPKFSLNNSSVVKI